MPGLVNAHTHLYQNFLKGVSPGLSLVPWCNEVLFPTVGALRDGIASRNDRSAYLWSAAAVIEMIKGGTTCCLDMDLTMDATLAAWRDLGFRSIAGYTISNRWIPEEFCPADEEIHRKALQFAERWHQPGGMIQVFLAPSTPFLCDDNLLKWCRDQAEVLNIGIQIHVSEIASEVQESIVEWGMTPVERLNHLGLLTPRASAVHCVHVNNKDIDILSKSECHVVHCPKSNMKLADGAAPVKAMLEKNIPISVATDGSASNDLLDMWEEMRAAILLARVSNNDANALGAADAFRMATETPAKICQIEAGKIETGLFADLAVVELKDAHIRPIHPDRILEQLVFCARAGDVRDTIINGKFVMRDRKMLVCDEESIMNEVDAIEAPLYARRNDFRY
ncbi:MAG: amidohydrolase [Anaerolineales bacterium]|nr:amidohydrolase [Anaerolineales bacterium]